jgi:hypothetical protein
LSSIHSAASRAAYWIYTTTQSAKTWLAVAIAHPETIGELDLFKAQLIHELNSSGADDILSNDSASYDHPQLALDAMSDRGGNICFVICLLFHCQRALSFLVYIEMGLSQPGWADSGVLRVLSTKESLPWNLYCRSFPACDDQVKHSIIYWIISTSPAFWCMRTVPSMTAIPVPSMRW